MREGIAKRHARYMQMFGEDDWKKIDRKIQDFGNDYYRTDLFVDRPTMVQAIDDFETFRTGTPAMDAVAADMRQFYELVPASAPAVRAAPAPAPAVVQAPVVAAAPVAPKTQVMVLNEPVQKAQALKNEVVKEVIEKNPEIIEDMAQEIALKDIARIDKTVADAVADLNRENRDDLMMLGASLGALGLGVGIGNAGKKEPELTQEQIALLSQAGLI